MKNLLPIVLITLFSLPVLSQEIPLGDPTGPAPSSSTNPDVRPQNQNPDTKPKSTGDPRSAGLETGESAPYGMVPALSGPDRVTYAVDKKHRGSTVTIPIQTINKFCGDGDGCKMRVAMSNWDNTGRSASREVLLYINKANRMWRASNDNAGMDLNGKTEHVIQAWACYVTDGKYANFQNNNDPEAGFGILSWNQYNGDCQVTIID